MAPWSAASWPAGRCSLRRTPDRDPVWSRPDATAVEVTTHEWLPEITLEVRSYEIKRLADAIKLESVYEAAAHTGA